MDSTSLALGILMGLSGVAIEKFLARKPVLASVKQIALYEHRRYEWDMSIYFESILDMPGANTLTRKQLNELLTKQEQFHKDMLNSLEEYLDE
jgi:hypothetical protein